MGNHIKEAVITVGMKQVSIPGSKFILSLEDEENRWWLRLRINSAVEEEVPLTHLEQKAVKGNIVELLENAHQQLNELQIDRLQNEIWTFISNKLSSEKAEKKRQFGTIEDPRYEELMHRIEKLTKSVKNLEETISEKEQILT